jgi:glycosyltransferase involved in cell wall biosynthesis
MGKPVITTDSVGCRDTVEDGVTGWLVRPRDADHLADMFGLMLARSDVDAARMSLQARQRALRHFDEQFVLDAYNDAISTSNHATPAHSERI